MREYIRTHPSYRFDSVVSEQINYDLLRHLDGVERGRIAAPALLPHTYAARTSAAHQPRAAGAPGPGTAAGTP